MEKQKLSTHTRQPIRTRAGGNQHFLVETFSHIIFIDTPKRRKPIP